MPRLDRLREDEKLLDKCYDLLDKIENPPPPMTPERAQELARENLQLAGFARTDDEETGKAAAGQAAWDAILEWGMTENHTAAILAKVQEIAAGFTTDNPHVTPDKAQAFARQLTQEAEAELDEMIGAARQTAGGKIGQENLAGTTLLFWLVLTFGQNDAAGELSPEDAKAQIYRAWQHELDDDVDLAGKGGMDVLHMRRTAKNMTRLARGLPELPDPSEAPNTDEVTGAGEVPPACGHAFRRAVSDDLEAEQIAAEITQLAGPSDSEAQALTRENLRLAGLDAQ